MVAAGSPHVTGYLYPWDVLGDPHAAGWVKNTGVDRVALAAAYHSVRAGTPRHPARRVVDARSAALYLPAGAAFRDDALVPGSAAGWTGSENSFATAAEVLRNAGLPVDAWTVLTHSSAAGSRNPGLCVRNAFGDVYTYALCPSQPPVRRYAASLVEQILVEGKPDGLVLEAVGALGFGHQNRHEKTEGAEYSPWVQALLSLCFCDACTETCTSRGLDVAGFRSRVQELVLAADDPDMTPAGAREAVEFLPLLQVRWDAAATLLDTCLSAVESSGMSLRLSIHATPDPWATGPFVPAEVLRRSRRWPAAGDVTAVVPCWGEAAQASEWLGSMAGAGVRTGAYVLALPPKTYDGGGLASEWRALAEAGADELHVYHLGLASTRRLGAIGEAVARLRP
ncbi:conserved hypothetical alanine-rich protein [Pseudarthrobacter chlorophenolicus A6]|uniref:Conserved hypothetical alanine-rich protein n=1 Tax=Pseudarthrobacter chlorophenolicus (strain ATCC 700700 / DSM 12829 / CIP 107037 / JCM 12360 / KCTC 9906 / NCIMB 13794 / A6) TaxID=452863 RepID=B8H9J8_PSECP|nr:hypothetical protein [Pseudarthrobacter chlorophenolicus]ACL40067.1 conserved hypothetical alanine-rich protein [Pseudarthrobacter chlorophenolicus A6]SDQ88428.1 hypothetical protein SAMN04489738_3401 [Pseudarthrobacter chlorophenolicus]